MKNKKIKKLTITILILLIAVFTIITNNSPNKNLKLSFTTNNDLSTGKYSPRFKLYTDFDYAKDVGDMVLVGKDGKYSFMYKNGEYYSDNFFSFDEDLIIDNLKFYNGVGVVQDKNGLTQYLDLNGNILTPKYEVGSIFNEYGYAWVVEKSEYFIIDKKGNHVIDSPFGFVIQYKPNPNFFICNKFGDGENTYYFVLNGNLEIILEDLSLYYRSGAESTHIVEHCIYGNESMFVFKKDNKYGLYDVNKMKTISDLVSYDDFILKNLKFVDDSDEFYKIKSVEEQVNGIYEYYNKNTSKLGATDKKGDFLIQPVFEELHFYGRGSEVLTGRMKNDNTLYVFFDTHSGKNRIYYL